MSICRIKEENGSSLNILFVDDDIRYLRMIKAFVENRFDSSVKNVGYAENAEQALAEIGKRPFNLIFTDFVMGNINGIELARMAKNLVPGISIILVTGSPISPEIMDSAAEAGISTIISKPINLNILREIIVKEQNKFHDNKG